jgi:hypothetical protein
MRFFRTSKAIFTSDSVIIVPRIRRHYNFHIVDMWVDNDTRPTWIAGKLHRALSGGSRHHEPVH